ncbi:MAG: TRAP transporter small permease [Pseudomonadota bacterium]
MPTAASAWARARSIASALVTVWALTGGLVLVGVVLVNAYSVVSAALLNRPFAGDFELTEMGTAIAAFCFLPYAQLTGAHVSADIFSSGAGPKARAFMAALASAIAAAVAALLTWRMAAGLQDYREFLEFTGILAIPVWWAFVPALISLVLLVVAALVCLVDALSKARGQRRATQCR